MEDSHFAEFGTAICASVCLLS